MHLRSTRHPNLIRLGAVLAAMLSTLIAWMVMVPVSGIDLEVPMGSGARSIGALDVALAVILSGVAAIGIAALIGRRANRPRRTWVVVSVAVFLGSLVGPLTSGAPPGIIGSLVALHAVVAVVLIPQLAWTLPRGEPGGSARETVPGVGT